MNIQVGISNRHIHLTKEDYLKLFNDKPLEKRNDLVQKGEYATTSTLSIKGPKGQIDNVRLLGPFRPYTQVEISTTDTYKLGIKSVIRKSGDLKDAEEITIIGPNSSITKKCAIVAQRHIHLSYSDIKKYNLDQSKTYKIKINTEKSAILENVHLKPTENGVLELHLDTDDANATLLKQKDIVELIK